MLVGVCGFTSTGSSLISDFLKEFDENFVLDSFEFTLPYFPDGLDDLRYHLCESPIKYLSSDAAIWRFRKYISSLRRNRLNKCLDGKLEMITEDFLSKIIQVRWRGYGGVDRILFPNFTSRYLGEYFMKGKIFPYLSRIFNRNLDIYPVRDMNFSAYPCDFLKHAREYIEDILISLGANSKLNIVMDQPYPGNFPQKSFDYFTDPIAIVVDRDPRDNYLFAKNFLLHKGRQIPTSNVKDFVLYYKSMRENMPYRNLNNRILRVNMESMIYEYEKTSEQIIEFCRLTKWDRPKSIFDPSLSANNTQVFKRYPEFSKDIAYIEKELPDYLYDFEKYGKIDTSGKMFFGKSPLNYKFTF